VIDLAGAPEEIRTPDPQIRSHRNGASSGFRELPLISDFKRKILLTDVFLLHLVA
jgi:hypothetical protein